MSHTDYIGLRIARWRDLAGMTQRQLADKVGITREYVSLIETGRRPVGKRDLLLKLAQGVGVEVNDLTAGYDPAVEHTALALHAAAPSIRRALDPEEDPGPPRPVGDLDAEVRTIMTARLSGDYPRICALLPGLLTRSGAATEPDGNRTACVFVRACVTASLAFKSHGLHDLGLRLAERATATARAMDAPSYLGAAHFAMSQALYAAGSRRRALLLATRAADDLRQHPGSPDGLAWYDMLRLQAALVSVSGAGADPGSVRGPGRT